MTEPPVECQQGDGSHGDRLGGTSPVATEVIVTYNDWLIEVCWRHAVRLCDHLQRIEREWSP